MTVARTAAQVLEGHVTLEVESIDRMYLNLYVPQLQRELGVVGFFKQRGFAFASGAVVQPITNAFLTAIKTFVDDHGVDLARFRAGERKEDTLRLGGRTSDGRHRRGVAPRRRTGHVVGRHAGERSGRPAGDRAAQPAATSRPGC